MKKKVSVIPNVRGGSDRLVIKNAKEHNLKDVSIEIPRNQFVVMTGVSGSGKSSLAFDTIFKEGQRRYVASLSAYARQFIQSIDRPRVDSVDGLSPTICIDQKSVGRNPRSTVGTITEIYDFLRLLFSRLGIPHCPNGHGPIAVQTTEVIIRKVFQQFQDQMVVILAPIVIDRKGEYRKEIKKLHESGFARVMVDGKLYRTEEEIILARYEKHTIEVVVDRIEIRDDQHSRLHEAIQKAVTMAGGKVSVLNYRQASSVAKSKRSAQDTDDYFMTNILSACNVCGESIKEMEPKLFSFNSPKDCCQKCLGLGYITAFEVEKFIRDEEQAVFSGALSVLNKDGNILYTKRGRKQITQIFESHGIDLLTPWKDLPQGFRMRILTGKKFNQSQSGREKTKFNCFDVLHQLYQEYQITHLKRYQKDHFCETCRGSGLNRIALKVLFKGKNIQHYNQMQIKDLEQFFRQVDLSEYNENIWKPILKEIRERLFFLMNVGLDYLTLARKANTLSGGEAQRIRLASQIGSGLEGCLYVLDEPSIGLHSLDNQKLIQTLKLLKARRNSLIVIEHDEETMLSADHLVELGPRAGVHGGEVTFSAPPQKLSRFLNQKNKSNLSRHATAAYLLGEKNILIPTRRKMNSFLELKKIQEFNLKNLTMKLPLEVFTVLTGVSGSGKSTLLKIIGDHVRRQAEFKNTSSVSKKKLTQGDGSWIEKVIEIDQKPIGRTPRSNPATYTNVWEVIRDLFAQTKEARVRGYSKGRFSFNVKGGRCEECGGAGMIKVETQIFSPIEVVCEACLGKRFTPSTLDIEYRGKDIYEILEMNFEQAEIFFASIPKLKRIFSIINQIGLGYLKLGQPSTTLSGGEAQRVKIASELGKLSQGKTLYLLDEPTTGLHFEDIEKLLAALQKLVDQKNTVVVIEHNLEVIKSTDHIIELGPKGGDEGGEIIFTGDYEEILECHTPTGRSVKHYQVRQKKREQGYFLKKNHFNQLFPLSEKPRSEVRQKTDHLIEIRGLKTHNLKNIDLDLPKNQIIAFTGVSGSGKTSIALDSIFIEGQRKYLESLSTYVRRFLGRVSRPNADRIDHLSPSIAIDQKKNFKNSRSVIATQTEIYDSLRVLFANIGHPHCTVCDTRLERYSETSAARQLIDRFSQVRANLLILAPLYLRDFNHSCLLEKKTDFTQYLDSFRDRGYIRFYVDRELIGIDDPKIQLKVRKAKSVMVVIDRIIPQRENQDRLIEAIEKAYELGNGVMGIDFWERTENDFFLMSRFYSCPHYRHNCLIRDDLTPRHFSFNHQLAACEVCQGIGRTWSFDFDKMMIRPDQPFLDGLDSVIKKKITTGEKKIFNQIDADLGLDLATKKYLNLNSLEKDFIFHGVLGRTLSDRNQLIKGLEHGWPGLFEIVLRDKERVVGKTSLAQWSHFLLDFSHRHPNLKKFLGQAKCFRCLGGRLKPIYLSVKINQIPIHHLTAKRITDFLDFFNHLPQVLSEHEKMISVDTLKEIVFRTTQLLKLGLGYLSLDRKIETLSGGEMQRIRLSTQIGNQLRDVIYVLDEPTVGLHERDNQRLIEVIRSLKSQGNTVLIVEHDSSMIQAADYIVDVGPEAGEKGGWIIYAGENKKSYLQETSFYDYVFSQKRFSYPRKSTELKEKFDYFLLENIYTNNLVDQKVKIPLQRLVAFSGVSGSGKSSLLEWIYLHLKQVSDEETGDRDLKKNRTSKVRYYRQEKLISKKESFPITKVYLVDQTPVSLNRRSIILSYMDIYNDVRVVFSKTKMAKEKGYHKSYFSFNSHWGGCSQCGGMGEEEIEMHFISDVKIICEECQGKRFQKEVLDIYYQGKNIDEVLGLTFQQAYEFFYSFKKIKQKIKYLLEAGLGYLKLGFKTSLLSSGERQRLKIAHELAFENPENAFYLLDEPTTGLHFKDIERLILLLENLVLRGATVIVIEHNIEFLRSMDYLIELGPEGGEGGGKIINFGCPEKIRQDQVGYTAKYL